MFPDLISSATFYAASIARDREYLIEMIERHGNTICNRWKKKTQDKRHRSVAAALPGIAEHNGF
jgi:thioredoxin-related protein